jgi:hypothetical protein
MRDLITSAGSTNIGRWVRNLAPLMPLKTECSHGATMASSIDARSAAVCAVAPHGGRPVGITVAGVPGFCYALRNIEDSV